MATTRKAFLNKCQEIVDAQPTYKNGASNTSECDCIGMVKYGLRENGVSFSTSGTNYSFRHHVDNIRAINSASDLAVGDVVFKFYAPGDPGWNLPDKYRQGGSEDNGDYNDYYHIGVVKSVSPLEIIHMTSPSAKTDTKIGKWSRVASLKSQYISDSPEPTPPGPEPTPPTPEPGEQATVYAENGKPVKMRARPSTGCSLYWEVNCGTIVDVLDRGDEWSKIKGQTRDGLRQGYMMTKFLLFGDDMPVEEVTVTISGLTIEQAEALKEEYPQAILTVG